jgi:hypothetical protein
MVRAPIWLSLSLLLAAAGARADALDRLGEGGVLYGELRPVALAGLLKQLGIDELPEMQKLRQQLGGIDLLNPALLAPMGLDVTAPIAASVEVPDGAGLRHLRVVASLRDPAAFTLFAGGVAAGGQAPLARVDKSTPAGKAGVLFVTTSKPKSGVAIARLGGDALVIDGVDFAGGKPLSPVEIARRFPLAAQIPIVLGHGARRLFGPETAAAVYVDGRRLPELLEALGRMDLDDELDKEKPAARARLRARRVAELKRCIGDWAHSPSSFDDAGVALTAEHNELRLFFAWGTQGDPPLGGLRFSPVDDGAIDAELLGRQAPMVLAVYAASAVPFLAVKRGGVFQSADSVDGYNKRCGQSAFLGIAVRSWPQWIGATLADLQKGQGAQQLGPLSSALGLFGQLRNLLLVLRDVSSPQSVQFTVGATFDGGARALIEGMMGLLGATGVQRTIGKRNPTVYALSAPNIGNFVAGLESLPLGPLLFTFADSEDSLQYAYRRAAPPPSAPPGPATPIAGLHLDGVALAKMGAVPAYGAGAKSLLDLLGRLRRVDADLATDGDLLRLLVRAPLKR